MVSVVAGLGNPGRKFAGTRHNTGCDVLDEVGTKLGATFVEGRGEFLVAHSLVNGRKVFLIKPTTYMNNSGLAVGEFLDMQECDPAGLLVVYDDFHLPLGSIRMRSAGSDGGHNGMSSVIYHLQTDAIRRIRCGIRGTHFPEGHEAIVEYVLSPFDGEEEEARRKMVVRARDAVIDTLLEGFDYAVKKHQRSLQ